MLVKLTASLLLASANQSPDSTKDVEKTNGQFHQHFTRAFFVGNFGTKISNPKHSFVIFGANISYEKCAHKTLMKLTPN